MSTSKRYPSAVLSFITGPVRVEFDAEPTRMAYRTILTHLQKYSHFGFMFTWPFCVHFWWMWRLQINAGMNGGDAWQPGTEQGIYFRTPGYRWDAELGMKWTWGYVGGHLD